MSIRDGIRFGIGFVIGKSIISVIAKVGIDFCDKVIEKLKTTNETEESAGE